MVYSHSHLCTSKWSRSGLFEISSGLNEKVPKSGPKILGPKISGPNGRDALIRDTLNRDTLICNLLEISNKILHLENI